MEKLRLQQHHLCRRRQRCGYFQSAAIRKRTGPGKCPGNAECAVHAEADDAVGAVLFTRAGNSFCAALI